MLWRQVPGGAAAELTARWSPGQGSDIQKAGQIRGALKQVFGQ